MADTNTYNSFQKVEKWTTKEKFNALALSDIPVGTEYNLTGAIEEGELDSALQTKINGKLTAPTTPSEESAVTLLEDGTVGTKPLSEIGGGKLYRHSVKLELVKPSEDYAIYFLSFHIITSSNVKFTPLSVRVPEIYQAYLCTGGTGNDGATDFAIGYFDDEYDPGTDKWTHVVYRYNPMGTSERFEYTSLTDTVTEL